MPQPEISLLIDGQCPLCSREAAFLKKRDRGRGRLGFIDITDPGFDPGRYEKTAEQLMGQIHGILPDGRIVTGLEVFRRAYRQIGLGWLIAPTAWPLIRPIADAAYRWFARNRPRLTGRSCEDDRCGVPPASRRRQAGDSSATR